MSKYMDKSYATVRAYTWEYMNDIMNKVANKYNSNLDALSRVVDNKIWELMDKLHDISYENPTIKNVEPYSLFTTDGDFSFYMFEEMLKKLPYIDEDDNDVSADKEFIKFTKVLYAISNFICIMYTADSFEKILRKLKKIDPHRVNDYYKYIYFNKDYDDEEDKEFSVNNYETIFNFLRGDLTLEKYKENIYKAEAQIDKRINVIVKSFDCLLIALTMIYVYPHVN